VSIAKKTTYYTIYVLHTSSKDVDAVKNRCYIGADNKLWTVFWLINKIGNAQKAKVVYYIREGKRTEYFKVPFKNEDGYYSCLFGEQLLNDNSKQIVLVEIAKTALVSSIVFPIILGLRMTV
jgi:hypothetical protein